MFVLPRFRSGAEWEGFPHEKFNNFIIFILKTYFSSFGKGNYLLYVLLDLDVIACFIITAIISPDLAMIGSFNQFY